MGHYKTSNGDNYVGQFKDSMFNGKVFYSINYI